MSKKLLLALRFSITALAFIFAFVNSSKAQEFTYTDGNLSVSIRVINPCSGNNGAIRFTINSTEGGANASIAVIGPPTLFPGQSVSPGNTFIFNATQTLPARAYTWIIGDGTNTIGSAIDPVAYPPIELFNISSPSINKDIETNNTSCSSPNGQIQATINNGSKALVGGGSFSYTWTADNGVTGLPTNVVTNGVAPINLATELGVPGLRAGNYTLVVQDRYSQCSATTVFTITDPSPATFALTTPSPLIVCAGTPITLTLSGSEAVPVNYEIIRNGVATGLTFPGTGASPFQMTFASAGFNDGDVFQVRATNGFCTPVMMTGSVAIDIVPLPVPTITGGNVFCEGTTGVTYQTELGRTNYTWVVTGGTITAGGTINDASVTVTWTTPGANSVSVNYQDANGCSAATPTVLPVTVNPLPVLVNPQAKTICTGDNVAYEILLTPANTPAGTLFNWPDPDGAGPATAGVNVPMGPAGTIHINDVLTNATAAPITVTYVVTPTSGAGCPGVPRNVVITVSPRPVLVTPQTKTICSGQNAAYEILLTPANQPVGTTFSWADPDGAGPATAGVNVPMGAAGTTHINDVLTNVTGAPITVTYVVTPSTAGCSGTPQNVVITVNPAPVLVTPQSKIICTGDNTAYEILLTPANLPAGTVFNWPDPDGAGPATAGVNVPMGPAGTLHINDVLTNTTTAPINVTYQVTPTSGLGCPGVTQPVVITVNPRPVLVTPQAKTICAGDNAAYEILLNPANLPLGTTFSWPDPDGAGPATAGVNVPMGAAGTTHINDVLTNATSAPITVTYVVTPATGTCVGTPQNVVITVNPRPVLVTPQTKTICAGDNVAYEILLTPANQPAGTVFNWPDPDGAGPATAGVNVPMGAAGTLHINDVLTNATSAAITVTYQVTPTGPSGCPGVQRDVVITVTPRPVLVTPQAKTICAGQNTAYEILLNPANLPLGTTFSWPDPDGAGPATAGVNVPMGAAGTTHINNVLTNGTGAPITVTYVVTPSVNGCAGTPGNVVITVDPAPVLVNPQNKTICSGDNVAKEILLTPANQPAGTVFNWPDPDGAGPATAGVNVPMGPAGTIHINDVLVNAGTANINVTYRVTPSGPSGCPGTPRNIVITVRPRPVLAAGQAKTICSGSNVAYSIQLTPANLPTGTVFNWPDPDGAGPATAGMNVAMGAAGTIHINDILTNTTSAPIVVTYQITPSTTPGGCAGAPQNVAITVNPTPVLVTPQAKTICSGANTAYEILLNPLNQPVGTTFSWPDPDGAGPATAGVNVPMGAAGTTHINDVLTNTTGAPITVNYLVTPSLGSCSGTAVTVAITVNPAPVLVTPQTKAICSGDNVGYEILLSPANQPTGTLFNWPDPDGAGPATAGVNVPMGPAGTIHINDVLTNATTTAITVTYQVTPTSGSGCPGVPQNVVITVNPAPVLVTPQTKTICGGENTAYEILLAPVNQPAGTVFNWADPDGAGPATAGVNVPMGAAGTTHINDVLVNPTSAPITVTYQITPSSGGCPGVTRDVVITVNPTPVLVTPQTKTICAGDNAAYEILLAPANQPVGTVFNWPDPDGAGPATAGVNVPMGAAGTTHINDVLTNVTTSQITVTYVVTPSVGGCTGTPVNVDIIVSPAPVLVTPQAKTICGGENVAYEILLAPANQPAGTVFNWADPDGAGPATAGVNVAMGAAGTLHINDILTNTTGAPITVTYVVTPSTGSCVGAPQNIDITVNPAPVLVTPQAKAICSGDNVGYEILLNPANLPLGTVFNWADPDGAGPATAGVNIPMGVAGTIHINDALTNTTTAPVVVTYVVTASFGGCTSAPVNVDITVNPRPILATSQTKAICSGDNTAYEILLNPVNLPLGTVFNWADPDGAGPATAGSNVPMGAAGTTHINDVLINVSGAPITVTYVVTASVGGCTSAPVNVDITVNPAPALVTPQTKTICSGENTAYEILLSPANLPVGTVFNWADPDGAGPATAGVNVPMGAAGTTHINDVLVNLTVAPITVTYTVTPSVGGGCVGAPVDIDIVVQPAIQITSVTPTNVTCFGGNDGAIAVLATGGAGALTYTLNPGAVSNGTGNFGGLTAGAYTITITDGSGCSATANTTISEPAQIIGTVTGTTDICNGGTANITITFSGGSGQYFYVLTDGITIFPEQSTIASSITLGFTPTTTRTYSLVSVRDNTCTGAGLGNAVITVNDPADPNLAVDAAISDLCNNGIAEIIVTNAQNGVTYQLRNDLDDSPVGTAGTGTGANLSLFSTPLTTTTTFNVLATSGGCPSVELVDKVTVNVSGSINAGLAVAPVATPICQDGTTSIRITGAESGVLYQLRRDADNSLVGPAVPGDGVQPFIDIPADAPLTATTVYNVLATNGTCSIELTNKATVVVDPKPDATLPINAVITDLCANGTGEVEIHNSQVGVTYTLRNDADDTPMSAATPGNNGTITLSTLAPLTTTTTFNVLASSGGACADVEMTTLVTINVSGTIDATLAVAPQTDPICEGTSTVIVVTSSEAGVNYTLRDNSNNAVIDGPIGGGGNINLNTGNLIATTTFNVLASNGTCSIELTNLATVTVEPKPVITLPVNAMVDPLCVGGIAEIRIQNSQAGVTYQLRDDATDTPSGLAEAGDGGTIILESDPLAATTTFNVLASSGGACTAAELTTLVTVNVNGTLNNTLNTEPSPTTPICSGNGAFVIVQGGEDGVTYQLRRDDDNSLVGTAQSPPAGGGNVNLPTGNLTATTLTNFTFNVLASNGTCSIELTDKETIIVSPGPATTPVVSASPGVICAGNTSAIIITNPEVGVTYQVRRNADDTPVGAPVTATTTSPITIGLPVSELAATASFNVLASLGTCSVELGPVTVTVRPIGDPFCTPVDACGYFTISQGAGTQRPSCGGNDDGVVELIISATSSPLNNYSVELRLNGVPVQVPQQGPSGTMFRWDNLSPGEYEYSINDFGGHICTRQFSFQVETTVKATASGFVDATCFGEPTGQAVLTITDGASPYQVFYGGQWHDNYVSGNVITDLPPDGTYNILVRDNDTDACPAEVQVTINNGAPQITADFDTDPATCGNADGAINILTVGGGSGAGYEVSIDGLNFFKPDEADFSNLTGGGYTLTVRDGNSCTETFAVNVTFPGFINFDIDPVPFVNCGELGGLDVSGLNVGTYQIGYSLSASVQPTTFETFDSQGPTDVFEIRNLYGGQYFVFVKPPGGQCPTRQSEFVDGDLAVSFVPIVECVGGVQLRVRLTEVQGAPGNVTITMKNQFGVEESFFTLLDPGSDILLTTTELASIGQPGPYEIKLTQITNICPVEATESIDIPDPISAVVTNIKESYPDLLTGGFTVTKVANGGDKVPPYQMKIELEQAAVGGQTFETEFEDVGQNNNLDYEMVYGGLPAGLYSIYITDGIGCMATLETIVPLDTDIYVPNLFTPNNDGHNEVFYIRNLPEGGAKVVITNRWGKQVYKSDSYQNDWAAEGVIDGIYFFQIQPEGGDPLTGWVEVLRGAKP